MIKNRFIKNTSWLLFGQILKLILTFFIGVLTARYLGPANNGIINYVHSYISFFTSIVGLGLNSVIIYEFVNNREEEGKILGTAMILRFLAGIVSTIAFLGVIFATDGKDKTIMLVAVLQAVQLPFLCLDTINYWFQSKMQSKYSALAQAIAYIIMALYKIYLIVSGKSVVWFAFAVSLDIVVLGAILFLYYNKYKSQKLSYSYAIAIRILKSCLPFILANIMVIVYGHMDRIMIKQLMNSTTEVGLYSAAITICGIIGFIPVAILDSARPLIAEAHNESEEKFRLRFKQLAAGIIWICLLYSLFITVFSRVILYVLYGADYMDANICLKIAVWYTSFSYLGSARSFWLICQDKKKYVFVFSLIGAICNVIMNFIFIPLWGINGAAFATLLTQIFVNFVIPFVFKETRDYGRCIAEAFILKNVNISDIIIIALNKLKSKHS